MQKCISFLELYAPSVLRLSMAAVILWFSLAQFGNAQPWTAYVPDSIVALTHLSATTLVFFNATFELIFGILLVFGWQTRIVALLLAVHLFDIMWTVGYGEIGVRDFGLAFATLVVCMNGPDILCVHPRKKDIQTTPVPTTQSVQQPRKLIQ